MSPTWAIFSTPSLLAPAPEEPEPPQAASSEAARRAAEATTSERRPRLARPTWGTGAAEMVRDFFLMVLFSLSCGRAALPEWAPGIGRRLEAAAMARI